MLVLPSVKPIFFFHFIKTQIGKTRELGQATLNRPLVGVKWAPSWNEMGPELELHGLQIGMKWARVRMKWAPGWN